MISSNVFTKISLLKSWYCKMHFFNLNYHLNPYLQRLLGDIMFYLVSRFKLHISQGNEDSISSLSFPREFQIE